MKPGPPAIIKLKKGGYKIISESKNISDKNITKVYKSNFFRDELLWEFDDFIGHKEVFLSPDGLTLILFGNVFFGRTFRRMKNLV